MSRLNGNGLFSTALYGLTNTYSILAQNSKNGITYEDLTNPSAETLQQLGYNPSFSSYLAQNFSALDEDGVEIVGIASNFKSKNVGVQMAFNNAVVTYAQRAGGQVKGRVASDISGDGTDAEGEFEHFYAAYEREVEKEIKG